MGRGGLYAIAAGLCLAAVAGIVVLVVADGVFIEVNLIYTAGGLLLFGTLAVVGLSTTGTFAWVGWLAALAAVAGFGLLMIAIWPLDEFDDGNLTLFEIAGSFAIFSFALAWAAIVLNRVKAEDNGAIAGLVVVTLLAILTVATLLTVTLVSDAGDVTYFRITAVIAVVGTLTTVLVPIARGLRRSA